MFLVIQIYLKKQEENQINNLALHIKQLDKEEMQDLRVSRRNGIIKIRAEINGKERGHSKNQQNFESVLMRWMKLDYTE